MTWGSNRHWGDKVAETFGAGALGLGSGGSAYLALPALGFAALAPVAAAGALLAGSLAGYLVLRRIGNPSPEAQGFVPISFDNARDEAVQVALSEVTAETRALADELVLGEPEPAPEPDARVVKLFKADAPSDPGELVERIADFLDGRGSCRPRPQSAAISTVRSAVDASQALHSALADIRRSLGR